MPLQEIFRAPARAQCDHRAFVLRAVGIGSEVRPADGGFGLFVEAGAVALARDQLARYEAENSTPIKPRPVYRPSHRRAWVAPALYAMVLLVIGWMAGRNFFGLDWYAAGALSSSIPTSKEWWRAITALTMHVDHEHLLSNLGFGALFLFLSARWVGAGVALLAATVAAILGNVLDAILMPKTHVAIGASTLVFATLGLLSAYSWRLHVDDRLKWAHRFAPLIAGVMLLGFIGAGGETTDVLAHLTGFACGVLIALLIVAPAQAWLSNRAIQVTAAALSIAIFIAGWSVALTN